MTKIEILKETAFNYLGVHYKWGGDDPMAGFDCSGYVIECLRSVGLYPQKSDTTAQGLYNMFKAKVDHASLVSAEFGDLVFYKNLRGRVVHVEMCLGSEICIGASGGGSRTTTVYDAIKQNAYIKCKPINSRRGYSILSVSELL